MSPPSGTRGAGRHPDPIRAAHLAVLAGADGITAHLREDRRHIRDHDMERLKRQLFVPLNFEMAATDEMVGIATRIRPHAACLVPEKREERTTEGGLDIIGGQAHLRPAIAALKAAGIRVSLFVEPEIEVMQAACDLGAPIVELHTGTYCEAVAAGDEERIGHELRGCAAPPRTARAGPRSPCRPRPRARFRAARRRHSADRRTQYRPFADRRGGVHGP